MAGDDDNQDGGVSGRKAVGMAGLALGIPWMIAVPALVGWYVDKHYGTQPLWFLVGLILGLIGTALDIYKLLKRLGQFK
jgi:F0F1-type ATP synthase assembly protein I